MLTCAAWPSHRSISYTLLLTVLKHKHLTLAEANVHMISLPIARVHEPHATFHEPMHSPAAASTHGDPWHTRYPQSLDSHSRVPASGLISYCR
jgi:hypothetical protein